MHTTTSSRCTDTSWSLLLHHYSIGDTIGAQNPCCLFDTLTTSCLQWHGLKPEHRGEDFQHFIVGLMPHGGTQIDHTLLHVITAVKERRGEALNISCCHHADLSAKRSPKARFKLLWHLLVKTYFKWSISTQLLPYYDLHNQDIMRETLFSDPSHLSWFRARGTFILVLSSRDRSIKADS